MPHTSSSANQRNADAYVTHSSGSDVNVAIAGPSNVQQSSSSTMGMIKTARNLSMVRIICKL